MQPALVKNDKLPLTLSGHKENCVFMVYQVSNNTLVSNNTYQVSNTLAKITRSFLTFFQI